MAINNVGGSSTSNQEMGEIMKKYCFLGLIFAFFSSGAIASDAMVKALAPLTREPIEFRIVRYDLKGSGVGKLLRDFAERINGWETGDYRIVRRMAVRDFPEPDGGENVIGFARILDVLYLVTDSTRDGGNDAKEAIVKKALFKARDLGGRVGVVSSAWQACGVDFPGVFILDKEDREAIVLTPPLSDC